MIKKVIHIKQIVVKRSLLGGYFAEREKYWSDHASHDRQVAKKHYLKEDRFHSQERELYYKALTEWDEVEKVQQILHDHAGEADYQDSYRPDIAHHNSNAEYFYEQSRIPGSEAEHYHKLMEKKLKAAREAGIKADLYRNMPIYLRKLDVLARQIISDYQAIYDRIPGITTYYSDEAVKRYFDVENKQIRLDRSDETDWAQRIFLGTKVASTIRHMKELLPAIEQLQQTQSKESLDKLKNVFKQLEHIKHWKVDLESNIVSRPALRDRLGKMWEILKLLR